MTGILTMPASQPAVCVWSGCNYPVMQNGDNVHCREHAGMSCKHGPAVRRCEACRVNLCAKCKHTCPPPPVYEPYSAPKLPKLPKTSDIINQPGFYLYRDYTDVSTLLRLVDAEDWASAEKYSDDLVEQDIENDDPHLHRAIVFYLSGQTVLPVAARYEQKNKELQQRAIEAKEEGEKKLYEKLHKKWGA